MKRATTRRPIPANNLSRTTHRHQRIVVVAFPIMGRRSGDGGSCVHTQDSVVVAARVVVVAHASSSFRQLSDPDGADDDITPPPLEAPPRRWGRRRRRRVSTGHASFAVASSLHRRRLPSFAFLARGWYDDTVSGDFRGMCLHFASFWPAPATSCFIQCSSALQTQY